MKWTFILLPVLLASCAGSSAPSSLVPYSSASTSSPDDIGGPGVEVNNQSCLNGIVAKGNCHNNRRFFTLAKLQSGVQYKNAGIKHNYFTTLTVYNHTYKPVIVTPEGGDTTQVCPPQTRCPATGSTTLGTPAKGIQIVYN